MKQKTEVATWNQLDGDVILEHHLHGARRTSSHVGQAVTSCREYLGPQPLAKLILTEFGSIGPLGGNGSQGLVGAPGTKMFKQCPGGTR